MHTNDFSHTCTQKTFHIDAHRHLFSAALGTSSCIVLQSVLFINSIVEYQNSSVCVLLFRDRNMPMCFHFVGQGSKKVDELQLVQSVVEVDS